MENTVKKIHELLLYVYSKILYIVILNVIVIFSVFYYYQGIKEEYTAIAKMRTLVSENFFNGQPDFLKEDVIFEEFVDLLSDKNIINNIVYEILNSIEPSDKNQSIASSITRSLQQEVFNEQKLKYTGMGINISLNFNDPKLLMIILDRTIKELILFKKKQVIDKLENYIETFQIELFANQELLDMLSDSMNVVSGSIEAGQKDNSKKNSEMYGIDLNSIKQQNELLQNRSLMYTQYLKLLEEKNRIMKNKLNLENFIEKNLQSFTPVQYTNLDNKIRSNKTNLNILFIIILLLSNFIYIFIILSFKIYISELRK